MAASAQESPGTTLAHRAVVADASRALRSFFALASYHPELGIRASHLVAILGSTDGILMEALMVRRPHRTIAARFTRRLTALVVVTAVWWVATPATAAPPSKPAGPPGCQLKSAKGDIQRVIYLIFDNVHFLRDNPNVPSDLEQMPNLLNFIQSNGTLLYKDEWLIERLGYRTPAQARAEGWRAAA
jgi:hypothetical protein